MKFLTFAPPSWFALVTGTLCVSVSAQTFDQEELLTTQIDGLAQSTLGDVDGDGDLDWVACAGFFSRVVWSENLGVGRFAGTRALTTDFQRAPISSVALGDLDGDGDMDLLTTRSAVWSQDAVGWQENLGAGRFGPYQMISASPGFATHARAADIDNDGDLDVVLAAGKKDPAWYENLGGGMWGPTQFVGTTVHEVGDLEVVDFDGDGDLDLLWADTIGSDLYWADNLGAGVFAPSQLISVQVTDPADLQAVDLDGDSDVDLLVASRQGEALVWFENLGAGNLAPRANLTAGFGLPERIHAADWDNDGDLDIVAGCNGQPGLLFFENQGALNFAAPTTLAQSLGSWGQLFPLDTEQDGDLDILISSGECLWAENLGTGWSPVKAIAPRVRAGAPFDWNGDGRLDLLSIDTDTDTATLHQNDGQGHFPPGQALLADWTDLTDAELFDADGDGDLDMLSAAGSFQSLSSRVDWHQNQNGTLVHQGQLYSALADSNSALIQADMDADGDSDFVIYHLTGFSSVYTDVSWIRNDGGGVFLGRPKLVLERMGQLQTADLNGDGNMDYVCVGRSFNNWILQWCENLGGGTMGSPIPIQVYPNVTVSSFAPRDLDGDGDTDLLVAQHGSFQVEWIENLGAGQFAAPIALGSLPQSPQIVLGEDFDLDGDIDALALDSMDGHLFLNQGNGTFAAPLQVQHNSDLWNSVLARAADMDGDGDLDLIKESVTGTLLQRNDLRFGEGFCVPSSTHSGGTYGKLYADGSRSAAQNNFALVAYDLPAQQTAFFLVADQPGLVVMPGSSQGNLCVGGAIGRMNRNVGEIFLTGASGSGSVSLDLTNVPTPFGPEVMQAGTTRYFQAWFRDQNPSSTSNFSEGLKVSWH